MKNIFKVIIISLFIASPALVSAQKVYKFGHINSQEVAKGLPDMDSVQVKYQKYYKELGDQLEAMQVEYNNKLQKYLDEKDKLTDLIRKTKEEELNQFQQRIQQFQENARTELETKNAELMQPVIDKIKKAISEVGKENAFTYIFDIAQNTVVYFSADSQDVTALVKQKLGIKK
jgi:outer membrane protein